MRIYAFLGFLGACADATTSDLPSGWEAAERLEKLMQMTCGHSGFEEIPETVSRGEPGEELEVTYEHAHFRCEQPVAGYLREHDSALEVLVQPIDMNPDGVAGCDCRYTIKMQVPLEPDTQKVTVYRRWENGGSRNEPVRIGSVEF